MSSQVKMCVAALNCLACAPPSPRSPTGINDADLLPNSTLRPPAHRSYLNGYPGIPSSNEASNVAPRPDPLLVLPMQLRLALFPSFELLKINLTAPRMSDRKPTLAERSRFAHH